MKVGLIGCGHIAEFHLPHILRYKSVEAVSLADINRQRTEEIAKRFKLSNVYTDFEAMLKEQRPEVAHILTPPATHAKFAIKAMDLGCHVLVEKPMALNLAEAEAMVAASRKNGVKLCVDHNNLWEPLMLRARQLVEDGKAGKVRHVDVYYHFDAKRIQHHNGTSDSRMNWLMNLPGGLVFDLLPHPVSILLHFLGEPEKISAVAKRNGILSGGLLDELRVLFNAAEATGTLSISLGIKPDCITTTIYATEMTIHVNLSNMTLVVRRNKDIPKKILRAVDNLDQAVQLLSSTVVNGLKVLMGKMPLPDDVGAVITKFYESVENGAESPVTAEKGRAVVKVTQQIAEQIA